MPPSTWLRLRIRPKTQRKLFRAMEGRALFWVTKNYKREIGMRGAGIMREMAGASDHGTVRDTFARRLREHFDALRQKGVPFRELGDRMIQDLEEMQQLIEATNPDRKGLFRTLQNRPLEQALNEMRQHYRAMQQAQGAAVEQQRRKAA